MAKRQKPTIDYTNLFTRDVKFSAIRSRGPGGQNVNKVSSAVELRWDFLSSQKLNDNQKNLIAKKLVHFINKEDELFLKSDVFRDQERNKSECISKLNTLLEKAFFVPKIRKKTKPTKSSQKERVDRKKQRGDTKKSRSKLRPP